MSLIAPRIMETRVGWVAMPLAKATDWRCISAQHPTPSVGSSIERSNEVCRLPEHSLHSRGKQASKLLLESTMLRVHNVQRNGNSMRISSGPDANCDLVSHADEKVTIDTEIIRESEVPMSGTDGNQCEDNLEKPRLSRPTPRAHVKDATMEPDGLPAIIRPEPNAYLGADRRDGWDGLGDIGTLRLGGVLFHSRDEVFQRFGNLLHHTRINDRVPAFEQDLLLELVKKGHRAPNEKIGVGVDYVWVGRHAEWRGQRCFMLHRFDGTDIDFSYRKCINNLFLQQWELGDLPPLVQLRNDAKRYMGLVRHRPGSWSLREGVDVEEFRKHTRAIFKAVFSVLETISGERQRTATVLAIEALGWTALANKELRPQILEHRCFPRLLADAALIIDELQIDELGDAVLHLSALSEDAHVLELMEHLSVRLMDSVNQMRVVPIIQLLRAFAQTQIVPKAISLSQLMLRLEVTIQKEMIPLYLIGDLIYAVTKLGLQGQSTMDVLGGRIRWSSFVNVPYQVTKAFCIMAKEDYYPNESLANELCDLACSQQEQLPSYFATWIWTSIVALRHKLPPVLLKRFLGIVEERLNMFSASDLSKWIWGLGNHGLDVPVYDTMLARLVDIIDLDKKRNPLNSVELWMCLWSMAILGKYDMPEFTLLWERACRMPIQPKILTMAFQVSVATEMAAPHLDLHLPEPLFRAAKESWQSRVRHTCISSFHSSVCRVLKGMGFSFVYEHVTENHLCSVDIALLPPQPEAWRQQQRIPTSDAAADGNPDSVDVPRAHESLEFNEFGGNDQGWDPEDDIACITSNAFEDSALASASVGSVGVLEEADMDDIVTDYKRSQQINFMLNEVEPQNGCRQKEEERQIGEIELERLLREASLPKVAIEVDGPSHFFRNSREELGRNGIRQMLLKKLGWTVVHVPYYDWADEKVKAAYLLEVMEKAGVNSQDFLGN
ncbi:unnamed protein product [Ostreobium quekettii]|uniref:RAP domain-containing protein n=1 Tax=Ostreobium quekettii TaxID=121088 RepID=A0A8S1JG29_9CHLO|nr:unnamed protein product [Ostreobium quekettii]|eukprot:evm.model.scf_847EXC.2 EVM.evm.TU.scf_847EXC.2   scf_847EXC:7537-13212(+)